MFFCASAVMAVTWCSPPMVFSLAVMVFLDDAPKQSSAGVKFVVIDGMWHAGITAKLHRGAHSAQHGLRLLHTLKRNVWIRVASSEKYRRLGKRAGIVSRRAGGPNQAAGQSDDGAVATRMSGNKLERQARALRKAEQCNAAAGNATGEEIGDKCFDAPQRRIEKRLIRFHWGEKRVWVPRVAGGLRRQGRDSFQFKCIDQGQHALCRGSAAVHEQQSQVSVLDCGAGRGEGLVRMRVGEIVALVTGSVHPLGSSDG